MGVSIHARTWRATHVNVRFPVLADVSIHARTWRATGALLARQRIVHVSIHARTWRATFFFSVVSGSGAFQFTPARGGRPFTRSLTA